MTVDEIITQAGGVTAIARTLGLDHSSVIGWRRRGQVPAERCVALHKMTGIPLSEIRADIYTATNE